MITERKQIKGHPPWKSCNFQKPHQYTYDWLTELQILPVEALVASRLVRPTFRCQDLLLLHKQAGCGCLSKGSVTTDMQITSTRGDAVVQGRSQDCFLNVGQPQALSAQISAVPRRLGHLPASSVADSVDCPLSL